MAGRRDGHHSGEDLMTNKPSLKLDSFYIDKDNNIVIGQYINSSYVVIDYYIGDYQLKNMLGFCNSKKRAFLNTYNIDYESIENVIDKLYTYLISRDESIIRNMLLNTNVLCLENQLSSLSKSLNSFFNNNIMVSEQSDKSSIYELLGYLYTACCRAQKRDIKQGLVSLWQYR
jgi:hypothetical protein